MPDSPERIRQLETFYKAPILSQKATRRLNMPKKITPEMTGFDPNDPTRFTPYRPLPLKIANKIVYALDRVGGRTMALDEEKLIREACQKTGLSDFGDESFREPLKILCEHSRTGKPMTMLGRKMMHDELLNRLMNKLKIQAEITANPEILHEKIEKPIFVLGLPRTGTTLLHRLLAQDPAHRAPLTWEMSEPSPAPEPDTFACDPRIKKSQKIVKGMEYAIPAVNAIHEIGPNAPEECWHLMANDLYGGGFCVLWDCPLHKWILEQDFTHIYQSHKRQLQLLQWKFPQKHWVLKWPLHLNYIEDLLRVYPDARIIQTHRDLIKVAPSISSLFTAVRAAVYDDTDPRRVGVEVMDVIAGFVDKGARQRCEAEQREGSISIFHDVYFTEFVKNPISTIEKIYKIFEMKFTGEARKSMVGHLKERPRHKHGKHAYTLEQFGFTESGLRERFQEYYQQFSL